MTFGNVHLILSWYNLTNRHHKLDLKLFFKDSKIQQRGKISLVSVIEMEYESHGMCYIDDLE